MCVDFTDLNKACPKGPFFMPQIDKLVDAIVGHPRMSFLNVFQGYHQIPLALGDQEKTTFVTYWKLPLQGDAFWFEECRIYLSEDDE